MKRSGSRRLLQEDSGHSQASSTSSPRCSQRQNEQITFHRCLRIVGSMINSLWVLYVAFIVSFIALLQALDGKDSQVGSHMCKRDLLVPHALRIHGVAEQLVVSADDVNFILIGWHLNTEFKFFVSEHVGKAAGVAGNGELRAHHAIQRPSRRFSADSGFS